MKITDRIFGPSPLNPDQLHKMAEEFRLPKRLLSEAQEVLLYHGYKPKDAAEILRRHCVVVRDENSGVQGFRRLLDQTIKK